jgi:hypothetical protein
MRPTLVLGDAYRLDVDTVWKPTAATPYSKEQTQIILDWDDTLLHTTWLKGNGYDPWTQSPLTETVAKECKNLAKIAIRLLKRAKKHGRVMIITAAIDGWVEASAAKFMPAILPHLMGVPIISARKYAPTPASRCAVLWKRRAFHDQLLCAPPRNVLSIGDGIPEQEAMRAVRRAPHLTLRTKIVKLLDNPCPNTLTEQLRKVLFFISQLVYHPDNLDLKAGLVNLPL